jgi:hypothetical protein
MLVGARGELAVAERVIQSLHAGQLTMSQLSGRFMLPASALQVRKTISSLEDFFFRIYLSQVSSNQAALLEYLTQVVEIAKLPLEEQLPKLRALEATLPNQPMLCRLLAPAASKIAEAVRRTTAELRCALVAIALERYRQAHGRWPQSLASLVPEYLPAVPIDPYDMAPLRFRRLPDGVVVYSVGLDGKDDGGNLGRTGPNPLGPDLGFQLWDVESRHQ